MSASFQIPGLTTLSSASGVQITSSTTSSQPVSAEPGSANIQSGQQDENICANGNAMDVDHQVTEEAIAPVDIAQAPASPPSLTQDLEALLGGSAPVPSQSTLVVDQPLQEAAENTDMQDAEVKQDDPPANGEWEADSSPAESSSSESSSDDSSDEDSDGEQARLNPKELARILMEEASDDEGEKKGSASGGQLRTKNEMPEESIPRPDVSITDDMKLVPLGEVESMVGTCAVIKAYTSGEYQVLEPGSALINEDRKVIAAVTDLIANVKEPRYLAYFADEEEMKSFNVEKGVKIFYTTEHSTFVFTQPLKAYKGTDASNLNDEELGVDEMEFSDDEQEAAYKRELKEKRRARQGARGGGESSRGARSGPPGVNVNPGSLNYDDEDDGPYRRLTRPSNFGQGPTAFTNGSPNSASTGTDSGSYRGGRGRGRGGPRGGDRGNRGGQRGGSGYSQPPATQQYAPQQQQLPQPFSPQQFSSAQGYPVPPPIQFFGGNAAQAPIHFPFPWAQPPQNLPAGFIPPPPPQFQQQGQAGQPGGYYNPALFQNQYQQQNNHGGAQPGQWPHQGGSG